MRKKKGGGGYLNGIEEEGKVRVRVWFGAVKQTTKICF